MILFLFESRIVDVHFRRDFCALLLFGVNIKMATKEG